MNFFSACSSLLPIFSLGYLPFFLMSISHISSGYCLDRSLFFRYIFCKTSSHSMAFPFNLLMVFWRTKVLQFIIFFLHGSCLKICAYSSHEYAFLYFLLKDLLFYYLHLYLHSICNWFLCLVWCRTQSHVFHMDIQLAQNHQSKGCLFLLLSRVILVTLGDCPSVGLVSDFMLWCINLFI